MALLAIGLGLSPSLHDLTRRAEAALRRADRVLVDVFTAAAADERCAALERLLGHPVERLYGPDAALRGALIEEARCRDVAIAVAGDPLVATPHGHLCREAAAAGVEVVIVPGVSAATAVASLSGRDAAGHTVVLVEEPRPPGQVELASVGAALDAGRGCIVLGAGRSGESSVFWPALAVLLERAFGAAVERVAIDGGDTALLVWRSTSRPPGNG
ncbi:MAG: hypothetical protein JXR83_17565 [Deltaproteobacteria bacterium]|nr:hypothetical protein [Deltaproteobacteria bacterium]